jgi:hypothetical protein
VKWYKQYESRKFSVIFEKKPYFARFALPSQSYFKDYSVVRWSFLLKRRYFVATLICWWFICWTMMIILWGRERLSIIISNNFHFHSSTFFFLTHIYIFKFFQQPNSYVFHFFIDIYSIYLKRWNFRFLITNIIISERILHMFWNALSSIFNTKNWLTKLFLLFLQNNVEWCDVRHLLQKLSYLRVSSTFT